MRNIPMNRGYREPERCDTCRYCINNDGNYFCCYGVTGGSIGWEFVSQTYENRIEPYGICNVYIWRMSEE